MISANWQAVILDCILIADLFAIALWFVGNFSRHTFTALAAAFGLVGLSYGFILIGDILLTLGYNADEHFLLTREWRGLPWRYGAVIGFTAIALILRFGKFNGGKK